MKGQRTFRACPIGVQVWQSSLVIDLLKSFGRLMIDLQNATGSPPTGRIVAVGHVQICASTTRRFSTRVVRNGTLQENWGRQLGGIVGREEKRTRAAKTEGVRGFSESPTTRRWHEKMQAGVTDMLIQSEAENTKRRQRCLSCSIRYTGDAQRICRCSSDWEPSSEQAGEEESMFSAATDPAAAQRMDAKSYFVQSDSSAH